MLNEDCWIYDKADKVQLGVDNSLRQRGELKAFDCCKSHLIQCEKACSRLITRQ